MRWRVGPSSHHSDDRLFPFGHDGVAFSLDRYSDAARIGNSWRTTTDINDSWRSVLNNW